MLVGLGSIVDDFAWQVGAAGRGLFGPSSNPNYGGSSKADTPMPQQWYDNEAIISRMEAERSDPNAPVTECQSTIITTPFAVCDWMIYVGGALVVMPLFMAMMGSGRR